MKVTFSLKNWRSNEEKKRRIGSALTEQHLFVWWMMILSTILQRKPVIYLIKKAKLKKYNTQAAHIISQQTTSACTPSLYPSCALLSVYIESVSDELFYIRFKLFKNKISLYVKKVVWEKKNWPLNVNAQYLSLENVLFVFRCLFLLHFKLMS